jgi:hypothetical protein
MDADLEEKITIQLTKGELLVIFDFLARSYVSWREKGVHEEHTFTLNPPDDGERTILWHLEGEIERSLPEVFWPEYRTLVETAKERAIAGRR